MEDRFNSFILSEWNTKLGVSAIIFFGVTRDDRPLKMCFFRVGGIKNAPTHKNIHFKHLNPKYYFLYHSQVRENKKEATISEKRTYQQVTKNFKRLGFENF